MGECEHEWTVGDGDRIGYGHCAHCGEERNLAEVFREILADYYAMKKERANG